MTTIPPLPSREDRDWLPWAQGVDQAARDAASKQDVAAIALTPGPQGPKGDPGPQGAAGTNATVTDTAMAAAWGASTGAKAAADPAVRAALVSKGTTSPAASLPPGTEYVWMQTDGAGTLLDIVSGVA